MVGGQSGQLPTQVLAAVVRSINTSHPALDSYLLPVTL